MLDLTTMGAPFAQKKFRSNPFFLLSACCMLGGCIAASNSLSWVDIPLPRLLTLIVTLNLYEAMLIGLGAYLISKRRLNRDGLTLLALEAFFLVDVTFLNAELSTGHLGLGLFIDIALLALAAVKLAVILKTLGVRQRAVPLTFILIQLSAILAIPLIFSWMDRGSASPLWFYCGWWIVGAMPLIYEFLHWIFKPVEPMSPAFNGMLLAFLVIPWLSLVYHLSVLHYDYGIAFYGADAAPILLGLAIVLNRAAPTALMPRRDLLVLRGLLPVAAVLVSANNPFDLCFNLNRSGLLQATPSRIALAAAYSVFVYCLLKPYRIYFFALGVAGMLGAIFGPNPADIAAYLYNIWRRSEQTCWNILPKTLAAWGVISVIASFAFLGIGAIFSLRRRPSEERERIGERIIVE